MIEFFRLVVFVVLYDVTICQQQDVNILLQQGTIVGLKVFPETSRSPVYTYLGIPYAEPPIDSLRFAVSFYQLLYFLLFIYCHGYLAS